ncbi:MAG: hypothetical protein GY856_50385 [bacterium]|nr:hypothetical protein [bacterium]
MVRRALRIPVALAGVALVLLGTESSADDGHGTAASRATVPWSGTVPSTDVPRNIPDDDPAGVTSTVVVTEPLTITITDVNLIFDEVRHTCVPDLHVELTSPSGTTTVVLMRSFVEGGILVGLGCPADFVGTVLDDEAAANLAGGTAPFTGWFNLEHPSVVTNPLSRFLGEEAAGTWTLFVSDLAANDVGTLEAWSLELSGDAQVVAVPTLTGAELAVMALLLALAGSYVLRRRTPQRP